MRAAPFCSSYLGLLFQFKSLFVGIVGGMLCYPEGKGTWFGYFLKVGIVEG